MKEPRKGRRNAYLEVVRHFAELIDDGQLKPGDQLPTYPEIEERFAVSHATATKAVRMLRDQNYVRSSTQGIFVHLRRPDRLLQQLLDVMNALEEAGQDPQLEVATADVCIVTRVGAVCWNAHRGVWEKETF